MHEYIDELKSHLTELTAEEQLDVINFYTEYLADAGIETYAAAVDKLGTPVQLARKVLADYSIKASQTMDDTGAQTQSKQPQRDVRTIWLIILAILSFATPVGLIIPAILITICVVPFSIIFSIVVTIAAFFLGLLLMGVILIGAGGYIIFTSFWAGVLVLGIGFTALGLFLLLLPIFHWLTVNGIHLVSQLFQKLYNFLNEKNHFGKRV
ncbi:DUF1700 domain-containing protein [Pediococcus acidilactici]|jgi:uncharacterized membrane protein|uniref:DUF1700 domain-containing protein n=3 Tax=Pediococcus acidilactici TaxID=1254 RepID=A0AAP3U2M7_PEDAC|nr:DUF1700 domain-containing protein [Pediococcus acidilactici]GAC45417.1 hypothetical protein PLO_0889 [Pediococcus acidilactici NGRI 0510Q]AOW74721.1 hypothetical protein A4V11_06715 [Pediococcus acidilactici]KAF0334419.1 DUF1700 domain-containing protein [Pediococcus acidilactici]KAF0340854.1 DUF1700 domain-containing protein [Pediococcus acidilactici]KAF0347759.1 DUF1700 domain-containing protein [Pediococcus acidilactici]